MTHSFGVQQAHFLLGSTLQYRARCHDKLVVLAIRNILTSKSITADNSHVCERTVHYAVYKLVDYEAGGPDLNRVLYACVYIYIFCVVCLSLVVDGKNDIRTFRVIVCMFSCGFAVRYVS